MAFDNITTLSLGDILQIAYSEGIRVQISKDFADFELIKMQKVADPKGRQVDFYLQSSLGPSAVQRRSPGQASRPFPRGQRVSTSEHTAILKELEVTIELDHNVWERAEMSKDVRYDEPLKVEMESKLTSTKRQLAMELHQDGTGVLATTASVALVDTVNDTVVFQLSTANAARGQASHCQFDEIMSLNQTTGAASAMTIDAGGDVVPTYWLVTDRDIRNQTVTCKPLDASFAAIALSSATQNVPLEAGAVFYKFDQPTKPNLGSITDYGTASEAMPGLDALLQDDGRVVHGMTLSGATKATRLDAAAATIDVTHIEDVMNDVKTTVGEKAYKWSEALLAPQAYSTFILGREDQRRFNSVEDTKRGARVWSYLHRDSEIKLRSSEFALPKRMYIIPEAAQGQGKVLEYHGSDFKTVKAPGSSSDFRMAVEAGSYVNKVTSNMRSYGTLVCKHPAACAVIENFTF